MQILHQSSQHPLAVYIGPLIDAVNGILVDTQQPGSNPNTLPLSQTAHHPHYSSLISVQPKEQSIAAFGEPGFTGTAKEQPGLPPAIGAIAGEITLSLFPVIRTLLIGAKIFNQVIGLHNLIHPAYTTKGRYGRG
jgi:hypothetical protein